MAEWHQLSETQQSHASLLDGVIQAEKAFFDSIKHDYEAVKKWLDDHPKIKKTGASMAGLTGLYIAKRYNMRVK